MVASWHKKAFLYGTYTSYILFILALTGVITDAPEYLDTLNTLLKYYVCAFLLIEFNPLVRVSKRDAEFEREVGFSAGIFLLLTTTATSMASGYVSTTGRELRQGGLGSRPLLSPQLSSPQ